MKICNNAGQATGRRMDGNGFTLIEILVVIVIISIVSGIALITISHNQTKNVENLAHQLVQVITLAEHEAMLRPATLGLAFTPHSYQFFNYDPKNQWQPLTDKYLGLHPITNKIQVLIKIQDKMIVLNGKPQIIISESGDMTPFVIFLGETGKTPAYKIIGDANGDVKSELNNEE